MRWDQWQKERLKEWLNSIKDVNSNTVMSVEDFNAANEEGETSYDKFMKKIFMSYKSHSSED